MRIIDGALEGLKGLVGILLLAGVVLNFVNVCLRYFWGHPFAWVEEVMVFGLLFIVMAGVVVSTALDQNLKIDILLQIVSRRWRRVLKISAHCIWISVCLFLAVHSYTVVALMKRLGQVSMAASIPKWIPHSFILGALVLSVIAAVYAIVREFKVGGVVAGQVSSSDDDSGGANS